MRVVAFWAGVVLCAVNPVGAQIQEGQVDARLIAFLTEPRVPEFGEVYDLTLRLRIAPEVVAFLPDTLLPSEDSFSAGQGSWSTSPGPSDSVDVQAIYPIMSFRAGGVYLPNIVVAIRPRNGNEVSVRRAGNESLGLANFEIPTGAVQIITLEALRLAADEEQIPRPPADVLGGQWSSWLISAVALIGLGLATLIWILIDYWHAARRMEQVAPKESARNIALKELDRLRSLKWHTDDRIVSFYDASTGVLRNYSGEEGPEWGTALTSTELMFRLEGRWGGDSVSDLDSTVWVAERVKFGSHRPGSEDAEVHWGTIRRWIEGMPED